MIAKKLSEIIADELSIFTGCVLIDSGEGYDTEYYVDGKRHRADGPAQKYWNGYISWWRNGQICFERFPNGERRQWLNGQAFTITVEQFDALVKQFEGR